MSIRNRFLVATTVVGCVLGAAAPALAHGPSQNQGWWGYGYGMGPGMMGQGYGMGQGMMMAPAAMGQGQGCGMGPGMMSPGQGYGMGPGMMMQPLRQDLSAADVKHMMEHQLAWQGNSNLKLGKVEEKDADTVVAEVVTTDGSLVQRFEIDRHTGRMQPAQ